MRDRTTARSVRARPWTAGRIIDVYRGVIDGR